MSARTGELNDSWQEFHEPEDVTSDAYLTLRMKKIFSTLMAEFKPITQGAGALMEEEELKDFMTINFRENNNFRHQYEFDNVDEDFKRDNLKILGLPNEDLRTYIVYQYQMQLNELAKEQR